MATFLVLWSTAVIAFVLRTALSSGGSDGIGCQDDKMKSSSSSSQTDQGTVLKSKISKDGKEEHMETRDSLSGIKKAQLSKSAGSITGISEKVASPSITKSYVSEIGKVINMMWVFIYAFNFCCSIR